jgi:hypothetical protein
MISIGAKPRNAWLLTAANFLLVGCANQPIVTSCIPVKDFTPAEEQQMDDEIKVLPATAMTIQVYEDWARMRQESRACEASRD